MHVKLDLRDGAKSGHDRVVISPSEANLVELTRTIAAAHTARGMSHLARQTLSNHGQRRLYRQVEQQGRRAALLDTIAPRHEDRPLEVVRLHEVPRTTAARPATRASWPGSSPTPAS